MLLGNKVFFIVMVIVIVIVIVILGTPILSIQKLLSIVYIISIS